MPVFLMSIFVMRSYLFLIVNYPAVLQNKKVEAVKCTAKIQVLLNEKGVLERGKTKKEVENDLFFYLAPLKGGMLQPFSMFKPIKGYLM
jgi:hypothetical protein